MESSRLASTEMVEMIGSCGVKAHFLIALPLLITFESNKHK